MQPTCSSFHPVWSGQLAFADPRFPEDVLRLDDRGCAMLVTPRVIDRDGWRSLAGSVAEAVADNGIDRVVVVFEVCAAQLDGLQEFGESIYRLAQRKPVVSHIERAHGVSVIGALQFPLVYASPNAPIGLMACQYSGGPCPTYPSLDVFDRIVGRWLELLRPEITAEAVEWLRTNATTGASAGLLVNHVVKSPGDTCDSIGDLT